MENALERAERIVRLEAGRARRHAEFGGNVWPTPDDAGMGVVPIELAPGRGNLQISSGFVPTFPTAMAMVNRVVSFTRLFQSQPWVAAAIMRMLTWAVRVPLKAYKKAGLDDADRTLLTADDHPVAAMLSNPWAGGGGDTAHFVMSLLGPMLVHGNSVTEIDLGKSGDTITMTSKDWRYCQPLMPWRDSLEGFKFDVDTPKYTHELSIDQVLHLAWWSPTGPLGTSPLMQLGTTLAIEDAAQRYQVAQFRHGGRPPSAVLASEAFLGIDPVERQAIMKQLRTDMDMLYAGPENAGRPALLPPGLTWETVGHTSVEVELIDQRKVTREEIAAVYLIPPPMLGILERATYSNIGVQREMTYTDCLGPPLILIEQAINAQLCRDLLQEPDVFVEFDFAAVLRGDRLTQIDSIRDAIATAIMTPNEGRSILNMPQSDIPEMDEFFYPSNNLSPIADANKQMTMGPKLIPFGAPGQGLPAPDKGPDPTDEPDDQGPPSNQPEEDPNGDPQRGQHVLYVPRSYA
jgi:HK97 family phage portal protein